MPWLVDGEPLATGSCANACEAFSLDGCPTGQWCVPIDNEPKPGPIDGYCGAASGSGVLGTDCGANASICGEDLQCVQSPDNDEPVCEQLCDPTALSDTKGDCPPGRACSPSFVVDALGEISTLLDWGTCVPGCTPWVTVSQSGCSNGNWCLPMLFNAQAGELSLIHI